MSGFMRIAFLSLCLAFATIGPASAYPGSCQIELINDSHKSVTVHVTFDDGGSQAFQMGAQDHPHYIDLHYGGFCHSHAHVHVTDAHGVVYDGWPNAHATLRIIPH